MKVALVHDWLTGMRGGEKCLEACCELFPEADVFTLVYDPDGISSSIRRMNIQTSWIDRLPKAKSYFRYLLPFFPQAVETFELGDYDLVLSSSHCVAKGIFPHRAAHIAYVHAPMRYIWDQHDAYFGAGASLLPRAAMALWRGYLQRWDLRSAERVNFFIANSKNVAAKIKVLYGREAAVIHPPVDVERFDLVERQEPFYLIVSALVPYKRIDLAVDAFNELQLPLKIAGNGPLQKSLRRRAKSNIEFLGWVGDARLAELYSRCQAVIFPGEEDFGIVPLEAQASGRPVIAYDRGGARETVIGVDDADRATPPTGIFFPRATPASLIEAVERYRDAKQVFDPAALRRHAAGFSRTRFKSEMTRLISAYLRDSATPAQDVTTT
jgi:glycosyltransferase involved in cell wall biosynthesis